VVVPRWSVPPLALQDVYGLALGIVQSDAEPRAKAEAMAHPIAPYRENRDCDCPHCDSELDSLVN